MTNEIASEAGAAITRQTRLAAKTHRSPHLSWRVNLVYGPMSFRLDRRLNWHD
jgi:hypothetical protein